MSTPGRAVSADTIMKIYGALPDWKVLAIEKSGASLRDLEVALAWAADESDVMGKARVPLDGAALAVYQILMAGEEPDD